MSSKMLHSEVHVVQSTVLLP